ncbi:MAG: lamin tail domain-containing protein, partial [Methanothrix sp.]
MIITRGTDMKKGISIGFALVAIIGMLFAGFAAATTPTSSTSSASLQDSSVYIDSITTAATSNPSSDGSRIFINEINPHSDEHISIANIGDKVADLTGFQLSVQGGSSFSLPTLSLAPGNEVTVFFTDGTSSSDVIFTGGKNTNIFNDNSGSVSLMNPAGVTTATTSYTDYQSTFSSLAAQGLTSTTLANSSIAGVPPSSAGTPPSSAGVPPSSAGVPPSSAGV